MIARFIYTDCESDGPFSSGVGKKFKSVTLPSALTSVETLDGLRDRLPRNSLSEGYQQPNVPNQLTMAEFDALPKSWAFAQITQDTFAFERISTSGQCYGRNNRFDEGFIFGADTWSDLVSKFADDTQPFQLRPVDFVRSTGWLSPRGEVELEAAELDEGFYEISQAFREQLKADLATVRGLGNLKQLLTAFAAAQLELSSVQVPRSLAQDFYAVISIFTRLTPPIFAWQIGFSDVWEQPRSRDRADGSNPHFLLGAEKPSENALAELWAELASQVFAEGFAGKVLAKIEHVAQNNRFQKREFAKGLSALPLAVIQLCKETSVTSELDRIAIKFLEELNKSEIGYPS